MWLNEGRYSERCTKKDRSSYDLVGVKRCGKDLQPYRASELGSVNELGLPSLTIIQ